MKNPFEDFEKSIEQNIPAPSELELSENEMRQRTIDWYLARWDKFTGSRIPDLMTQGRGKNNLWGQTAKNVILELAAYATMTPEGKEQWAIEQIYKDFRPTKWGTEHEPEARELYAEKTGYHVAETGFQVHPAFGYIGGSFDGEVGHYEKIDVTTIIDASSGLQKYADGPFYMTGIIEIKCPYNPLNHMNNMDLLHNGGIDASHTYYGQIQNNIEVAGVEWCDFISYDPRQDDKHKIVIIRVKRDQIYIDAMMDRIHKAQFAKNQYLNGESLDNALKFAEEMEIDKIIEANINNPE